MSIPWMHGTIAKTKRMPGEMEQGFCMAEMPYKNHALFYIIGKLFELPYDIKSPLGRMRTQMQRKYVAEATHLRRRISQSEILFHFSIRLHFQGGVLHAKVHHGTGCRNHQQPLYFV